MKIAFSTVACPNWTFPQLLAKAENWGYTGIELRTFGYSSSQMACDPALSSPAKLRGSLERIGLSVASLATGIKFDAPISPPVLGLFLDHESMIRETKSCVDMAVQLEAPFVRIFGFEVVGRESRRTSITRIADRIAKCADYCRNSGVRLMIENGGSFNTAADLAEIIDEVNHPLLSAAYSLPVAAAAGDKIENGINVLGERLVCIKCKDLKAGKPVAFGEGDLAAKSTLEAAMRAGFNGTIVFEYDQAWLGNQQTDLDAVMKKSAQAIFDCLGLRSAAARPRTAKV